MGNHLQHIADLVHICKATAIEHVVLSPGSRNAPMIQLFAQDSYFTCHSIVDERSAGYFALGLSLALSQPVAIVCTSGTAVLNYAPAIAEAYYQHIPLLILTADRPAALIDQLENQTIRQPDIYANYVKQSLNLYSGESILKQEKQSLAIFHIIKSATQQLPGPVHINIPTAEPLYTKLPQPNIVTLPTATAELPGTPEIELITRWKQAKKILILVGEHCPDSKLSEALAQLAETKKVVILAEAISNFSHPNAIEAVNRIMMSVEEMPDYTFHPDLLVSFGGQIVSKRLLLWLKKQPDLVHWRISAATETVDTYGNLHGVTVGNPADIINKLSAINTLSDNSFFDSWHRAQIKSEATHQQILSTTPWSDLKVFHLITAHLPQNSSLHLGNGSPVRYAQLFRLGKKHDVYSNRGVSGIDGCVSTAVGFASGSHEMNVLLVGDLSFVYDSNGLWNKNLPENLRIIVINNQGGGIFRLIPGPEQQPFFKEYLETAHPVNIDKLAQAFHVKYYFCDTEASLKKQLSTFFIPTGKAAILEIKTQAIQNPKAYNNYIDNIKSTL